MAENLNPAYKELIIKAIEYHWPQAKIYLFGSRSRGDNLPGADVDIAIDTGAELSPQDIGWARRTLENLPIPLTVDLVDIHSIPEELKDIILRKGIVWKN